MLTHLLFIYRDGGTRIFHCMRSIVPGYSSVMRGCPVISLRTVLLQYKRRGFVGDNGVPYGVEMDICFAFTAVLCTSR